jgi:hypothetical protein
MRTFQVRAVLGLAVVVVLLAVVMAVRRGPVGTGQPAPGAAEFGVERDEFLPLGPLTGDLTFAWDTSPDASTRTPEQALKQLRDELRSSFGLTPEAEQRDLLLELREEWLRTFGAPSVDPWLGPPGSWDFLRSLRTSGTPSGTAVPHDPSFWDAATDAPRWQRLAMRPQHTTF